MPYNLRSAPTLNTLSDVRAWVEDELGYIEQAQNDITLLHLQPVFQDVDKPRDGMIVYADGVHFNPGAGAGSYEYRSGAWHKLAEDVDFTALAEMETDIVDLETAVAANTAAIVGPTAVSGFTDGSSAAAGKIGEYLSAVVQKASAVNLTANTNTNITSLSIPVGDWDVWADCYFAASFDDGGADCFAGLSTVSATFPTILPYASGFNEGVFSGISVSVNGMCIRVNVSSSTTYFLVAKCADALSGAGFGAFGQIQARRRR